MYRELLYFARRVCSNFHGTDPVSEDLNETHPSSSFQKKEILVSLNMTKKFNDSKHIFKS